MSKKKIKPMFFNKKNNGRMAKHDVLPEGIELVSYDGPDFNRQYEEALQRVENIKNLDWSAEWTKIMKRKQIKNKVIDQSVRNENLADKIYSMVEKEGITMTNFERVMRRVRKTVKENIHLWQWSAENILIEA